MLRGIPAPFLAFLACLGVRLFSLFLLAVNGIDPSSGGDMAFYHAWALKILQGHWADDGAFYGLPGYPAILAAIYSLIGPNPWGPAIVNSIADATTCALIFDISIRSFAHSRPPSTSASAPTPHTGRLVGVLAATGWILFQPAQTFSLILMPTSLATLVFWFIVWWFLSTPAPSDRSLASTLGMGVLIGLMATVVATVLFLVPWSTARLFRGTRLPRCLGHLALLLSGVVAGTSPCWLYNYTVAREPVALSAHSGVNFYLGNNPLANGYPRIPPGLRAGQEGMLRDSITVAREAAGRRLKHYEVSQYWSEKANAYIQANRSAWLALMGRKIWNFWNAWEYDDLSLLPRFRHDGIILPGLTFGLAAALGICGLLLCWRNHASRWIGGAVLFQMAALLPVFITERYRLLAAPGLIILASAFLSQWHGMFLRKEWLKTATWAGVAAGWALLLSTIPSDPRLWSLAPYNVGLGLLNAGRTDEAREKLETAWRYVPDNGEVNFALGNLWFPQDKPLAGRFYSRVLQLVPNHAGAWKNLGVVALESGNWPAAESNLRHACALNETPMNRYLLATALGHTGKSCEGLESIRIALRSDPSNAKFLAMEKELAQACSAPGAR